MPGHPNLAPLRRLRSLHPGAQLLTSRGHQLKLVKRPFRHVSETEAASSPLGPKLE